jgi:hypothetical protein
MRAAVCEVSFVEIPPRILIKPPLTILSAEIEYLSFPLGLGFGGRGVDLHFADRIESHGVLLELSAVPGLGSSLGDGQQSGDRAQT